MPFIESIASIVEVAPAWWVTVFVVFARVGVAFSIFPILGMQSLPPGARLAAGISFAILTAGLLGAGSVPVPASPAAMMQLLGKELVVGAGMGFVARCVISGLEFSGEITATQMGLNLGSVIDPVTNSPITPVTTFQRFLVAALFFGIGGHHIVLAALVRSYTLLPPGTVAVTSEAAALTMGQAVMALVEIGLLASAPAVIIVMVAEVVMMAVGRTVPQIPMLMVGFPVRVAGGLFGLMIVLNSMPRLTSGALDTFTRLSGRFLRALVPA